MTRPGNKQWQRILAVACTVIAVMALASAPARSSDVGVRVGYFFDSEALSIGMGVLTSLDNEGAWFFNPNLELGFGDSRNLAALNGDFHYDFETNSDAAVWVGAGPALLITDPQYPHSDNDVDPALNMFLGVGAKTGTYRPFAQVKGVLSDNSEAALAVGIRF